MCQTEDGTHRSCSLQAIGRLTIQHSHQLIEFQAYTFDANTLQIITNQLTNQWTNNDDNKNEQKERNYEL